MFSGLALRQAEPLALRLVDPFDEVVAGSIGPARSMRARITSDFGTRLRRAQRARRAARALSSLTVIVGMVIPRYYHVCFIEPCQSTSLAIAWRME